MDGENICHPVKDKCFTSFYNRKNGRANVGLPAYDGKEDQKCKWSSNDTAQFVTFNNLCLGDANGNSFIDPLKCDKSKRTQNWSFIPITDTKK